VQVLQTLNSFAYVGRYPFRIDWVNEWNMGYLGSTPLVCTNVYCNFLHNEKDPSKA
jgi:hypothetical protein